MSLDCPVIPVGFRAIAKIVEVPKQETGSLIITLDKNESHKRAEIIAIGKAKNGEEFPFSVGDVVLLDKYGFQSVVVGKEEFLVIEAANIAAKFKK